MPSGGGTPPCARGAALGRGDRGLFAFPDYLALGAQILAVIIFALSVDLVLG